MKKIDFTKEIPFFENEGFKWYNDKHFQNYLEREQASNLPALNGFGVFIVTNESIQDYVLIDSKQNVLTAYIYNREGFGQMEAYINIMKISKHYDEHEKNNI